MLREGYFGGALQLEKAHFKEQKPSCIEKQKVSRGFLMIVAYQGSNSVYIIYSIMYIMDILCYAKHDTNSPQLLQEFKKIMNTKVPLQTLKQ